MSRRLLLGFLTLTVLVLAALEVPLGITHARGQRQDLTTKVERDAVVLSTYAEDVLDPAATEGTSALAAIAQTYERDTGGRVVVVDASGDSIVDSEEPGPGGRSFASRPEIAEALAGQVSTGVRHSATLGGDLIYVAVPVASGGIVHGAVRVTYPISALEERILRYWLILAAIAAIVLGVVGVVGLGVARSVARPLANVERAAAAAAGGDLSVRAPTEAGPGEVKSLARAFNEMVARVEELVRSREVFVADASHQLRTPLAALRLRLENMEADVLPSAQQDLDAALAEVARLSRLVDGLLELARTDSTTAHPESLDLPSLVAERIDAWSALAAEQEVTLRSDGADGLTIRATPGKFEQVLDNLLANALEVSPAGSTVLVRGVDAGRWVEIHVTDQGPGMTAEERARAFDRFWRAGPGKEGTGLGLAIVERLVASDGGEVELRPVPEGGLDAIVRFRPGASRQPASKLTESSVPARGRP
jgi:signal transduction histidine kinase